MEQIQFELGTIQVKTVQREDAEKLYALIDTNKKRLEDYFAGTLAKTRSLEETRQYCVKIETLIKEKQYIPFLLLDTKKNKAIGLIDFKNIDWNVPKAELGAFIDAHYEGQGLISQAGAILIDQIVQQLELKKLYCRAAADNQRSINSILNYGFEYEGTIRRDYKTTSGRLVDLNYYGKLYD